MDHDARFRALFDEHYPAVARYVLSRGHQAADADDLIAETFEVAWRRMDAVPSGRTAIPWLLTVARNLSRNARRKSRRELAFIDSLAKTVSASAELQVEDRQELAEVMRALGELKTLDRGLILLVAWDGLTPSEAGRVLGLLPTTARSRLHRARQRLSARFTHAQMAAVSPPEGSERPTALAAHLTSVTNADDQDGSVP
jgi:RNA polymerase sigma-70 factor, ECF subfamily